MTVSKTGGAKVSLTSDQGALSVPGTVTVPGGKTTVTFTAAAGTLSTDATANVTASLNGTQKSFAIGLTAPLVTVTGLSCTPASLDPGAAAACTITVSKTGGATVTLASQSAAVIVPGSVTVPPGATAATFTAAAGTPTSDITATLTASLNGTSQSAVLTVVVPAALASLSCNATTLSFGVSTSCTVALTKPVGNGGVLISLVANSPALTFPATVSVPAGASAATFSVNTGSVTADGPAAITASFSGISTTAQLNLVTAPGQVQLVACDATMLASDSMVNCNVFLAEPAPPAGAVVSLASDDPLLSVLPFVTVPAGASAAGFQVMVKPVAADQSATVTATYSGTSRAITFTLMGAAGLDSVYCAVNRLTPGATITCTVNLIRPVMGSDVAVLITASAGLTVPPSVTVPAGASGANFSATVNPGSVNQTETISATLSGITRTFLMAAEATGLSSLQCAPGSLAAGETATCTFALNKRPRQATVLEMSSNSPDLAVPAAITVVPGSMTGTFQVTAGTPAADSAAIVTAGIGGSFKTAAITLLGPPVISSLTCEETSLAPGAATVCTVMMSRAGGELTVKLETAGSTAFSVPATVTVPAGSVMAGFAVRAGKTAPDSVQLTASLGQSAISVALSAGGAGTITSLSCDPPNLVGGGTLSCTVELTEAAPVNGTVVELQADSSRMVVPQQVVVPEGGRSAQFSAQVLVSDRDEESRLTARVEGVLRTARLLLTGLRPTGLVCAPILVQAGESFTCSVTMNSSQAPEVARLALEGDGAFLKMPRSIMTRPRQSRLSFKVFTDRDTKEGPVAVHARFGEASVIDVVIVKPAPGPVITVPGKQLATFGKALQFSVSAVDVNDLPVTLAAGNLPEGAAFDLETGLFAWTPAESQGGDYEAVFTAVNSAGESSERRVAIYAGSGQPEVTGLVHAATRTDRDVCSPGGVASLTGRWLVVEDRQGSDLTGEATELGGIRVKVNEDYAPVLSASVERVDFLCPQLDPGTPLRISLESETGASEPRDAIMEDVVPGVFTVDGSGEGQGSVFLSGTSLVTTVRNYQVSGQPAQAGDSISVRATGLGSPDNFGAVFVTIGDFILLADSVQAVPNFAGLYEVTVKVPDGAPVDEAVPLAVRVIAPDGRVAVSNTVTVAIEASMP